MVKKVELLAPAGNKACFYAAVHAGADAVYLAGEKFGARAYADNFTTEEACEAIRYGHLFGVRTYLTLNTLIKEREFNQIFPYVKPFYEAGLDGVIVQDLGVVRLLKRCFPDMEIHASTQMTVTGSNSARLLQKYGVTRVVPARELSLDELRAMKEETGVEMEIFIHGAMCYAYSGQCLFSSVLGGRSGNRGRCAGPCRLPYQIYEGNTKLNRKGQEYPLSLKDLCTIQILPELIMAEMDSFKIEGRMKSAEYVAAVTAIYRKYIDFIYEMQNADGSFDAAYVKEHYHVAEEDISLLQKLYVRTNLQDGYFHTHNGKELVTLQKPSYSNVADDMILTIRKQYIDSIRRLPVEMRVILKANQEAVLTLKYMTASVNTCGALVERADKRAMTKQDIEKQLRKMGNTPFALQELIIELEDDIFIPNKALNELRRAAVEKLINILAPMRKPIEYGKTISLENNFSVTSPQSASIFPKQGLTVSVNTEEQLLACEQFEAAQILFLSYDLLCQLMIKQGKATLCDRLHKIYAKGMGLYLLLPRVMRHQTFLACERLWQEFGQEAFDGIVTNSLEGFALLKNTDKKIIADAGLYSFNNEACRFLEEHGIDAFTVPYECSYHEIKEIHTEKPGLLTIYGYLPLMESAGCVAKTMSHCDKRSSLYKLTDRYQKQFFVKTHCNRCENTIYNSVPFNLMGEWEKLEKLSVSYRIDFTIESAEEVRNVLKLYLNCRHNTKKQMTGSMGSVQKNATFERAEGNYTKGYFKRGVE